LREFQRAPRGYELMVLINPEVTDEALSTEVDQIGGFITATGAEITYLKRDTPWGRRRLAYPIQRFRDATYVLYQFLGSPSTLNDIERDLKLDERIIRYLLVRQEHLHTDDEEPAPAEEAPEAPSEPGEALEAEAASGGDVETVENEDEPSNGIEEQDSNG
jgi:small subunit ribosomal protein S6